MDILTITGTSFKDYYNLELKSGNKSLITGNCTAYKVVPSKHFVAVFTYNDSDLHSNMFSVDKAIIEGDEHLPLNFEDVEEDDYKIGEWVDPLSSWIKLYMYDEDEGTLTIITKSRDGADLHEYVYECPLFVYKELYDYYSAGTYINKFVKGHYTLRE